MSSGGLGVLTCCCPLQFWGPSAHSGTVFSLSSSLSLVPSLSTWPVYTAGKGSVQARGASRPGWGPFYRRWSGKPSPFLQRAEDTERDLRSCLGTTTPAEGRAGGGPAGGGALPPPRPRNPRSRARQLTRWGGRRVARRVLEAFVAEKRQERKAGLLLGVRREPERGPSRPGLTCLWL